MYTGQWSHSHNTFPWGKRCTVEVASSLIVSPPALLAVRARIFCRGTLQPVMGVQSLESAHTIVSPAGTFSAWQRLSLRQRPQRLRPASRPRSRPASPWKDVTRQAVVRGASMAARRHSSGSCEGGIDGGGAEPAGWVARGGMGSSLCRTTCWRSVDASVNGPTSARTLSL